MPGPTVTPSIAPHPAAVVLVGGGGHALAVAEALTLSGHHVVGFLDDNPDAALGRLTVTDAAAGAPHPHRVGALKDLPRIADRRWALGLGALEFRDGLLHRLDQLELGRGAITALHPSAHVSPTARLGEGVYVGPGAVVHARALVMDHAIINSGAVVEHECLVGYNTHVAPGAVLAGAVRVGAGTLVGLGARVLPSLSIGDHCIIAAGAVVTRSVLDGQMIVGVPGRPRRRSTP
jgi:UDP-perosamine 4-acetyltransferase